MVKRPAYNLELQMKQYEELKNCVEDYPYDAADQCL